MYEIDKVSISIVGVVKLNDSLILNVIDEVLMVR